jgi:hypothetical protein
MPGFDLVSARKTDYIGTIVDAEFQLLDDYGTFVLSLTMELEDGTEWKESYSIGNKGWVIVNPQEIASVDGKGVTRQSMYGRFITRMMELAPEELQKAAAAGLGAEHATVWVGFKVHMAEERVHFGGKIDDVDKNFPDQIISLPSATPKVDYRQQLIDLAKASGTQDQFTAAALGSDAVTKDGSLVDQLDAIWNESKKG